MLRLLVGACAATAALVATTMTPVAASSPGQPDAVAFHRADGFIYSVNSDGSGLTRLGAGAWPTWSPDGERIAFVWNGDIWTMDDDGTARTRVTAGPSYEYSPTWSPDGTRIAFGRHTSRPGIFTVRSSAPFGAPVRLLSTPAQPDEWTYSWHDWFTWASNGLIYFSKYTDYVGDMCHDGLATHVFDPATGVVEEWRFLALEADPAPAADALVYRAATGIDSCNLEYGISIADADGTRPRRVTPPRASRPVDQQPVFSPDAERIAFQRGRYVMVVNVDGSGLRRLTVGSAPTWRPLPTSP